MIYWRTTAAIGATVMSAVAFYTLLAWVAVAVWERTDVYQQCVQLQHNTVEECRLIFDWRNE